MSKPTDIRPVQAAVHFLPIRTRVPLKFGAETLTEVTLARVRMVVADRRGRTAEGWGETPLSVQWVWPSQLGYQERHDALEGFCEGLVAAWGGFDSWGHPMEVGHAFLQGALPAFTESQNRGRAEPIPYLGALACDSAFDLALHDAYGKLHGVETYSTYNAEWMGADLAHFLEPAPGSDVRFAGRYPADFLEFPRREQLRAWHLVGGKDLLGDAERDGSEPDDGYPVTLPEWIRRDGLKCLKIKLRGDDGAWDWDRLVRVGEIAVAEGVEWLTADFNCTVRDPAYVNELLDRLKWDHPRLYGMLLYVEQPFPYDLEANRIDVHSVSARKPLFMDESAHDWELVRLGRSLGWNGVALKTCKTQTGALLSLCWGKAHGLGLMVQDLSNPALAQIPHALLAAHAGTIMGVETNGMQFYPEASRPEWEVHPGLYQRRDGVVDLGTLRGPGFGMRADEIRRDLPPPAAVSP